MDILGAWRLQSWKRREADGSEKLPMGPAALGRILYSADGMMSAFLMRPGWQQESPELTTWRRWFVSYSGRFELAGDVVSHHVDFATNPLLIGQVLQRKVTLEPGRMNLVTVPDVEGVIVQSLVWTR